MPNTGVVCSTIKDTFGIHEPTNISVDSICHPLQSTGGLFIDPIDMTATGWHRKCDNHLERSDVELNRCSQLSKMYESLEIIALGLKHAAAIAEYVAEFADAGEQRIHGYFGKPEWTHAQTEEKLSAWSFGRDLGGWVPSTTRFLISNGRILGNYNLRHQLTDALLLNGGNCGYSVRPTERRKGYATLMLGHAKELAVSLGLQKLLVTCETENIGSARTIENNGGILQDVVYDHELDTKIVRYWIQLR